jgi:hypothetical protein
VAPCRDCWGWRAGCRWRRARRERTRFCSASAWSSSSCSACRGAACCCRPWWRPPWCLAPTTRRVEATWWRPRRSRSRVSSTCRRPRGRCWRRFRRRHWPGWCDSRRESASSCWAGSRPGSGCGRRCPGCHSTSPIPAASRPETGERRRSRRRGSRANSLRGRCAAAGSSPSSLRRRRTTSWPASGRPESRCRWPCSIARVRRRVAARRSGRSHRPLLGAPSPAAGAGSGSGSASASSGDTFTPFATPSWSFPGYVHRRPRPV